jgi:hypothetical protein
LSHCCILSSLFYEAQSVEWRCVAGDVQDHKSDGVETLIGLAQMDEVKYMDIPEKLVVLQQSLERHMVAALLVRLDDSALPIPDLLRIIVRYLMPGAS